MPNKNESNAADAKPESSDATPSPVSTSSSPRAFATPPSAGAKEFRDGCPRKGCNGTMSNVTTKHDECERRNGGIWYGCNVCGYGEVRQEATLTAAT